MSKRQTVQKALTAGEIFDLGVTALQAMPRTLDPDKVRADLMHKQGLVRDLGKFFAGRYAAQSALVDTAGWSDFYQRVFNRPTNFSNLHVPAKPEYDCWPIVIVPGLVSNNDAFDACKKMLGNAWRYTDDLNTVTDIVERPKSPHVVWVRATIEADPDLANASAQQIIERKLNTLTLLERLVLELKHFDESKQYLDVENWTLCAGSRSAGGGVPIVSWRPAYRELSVSWCGPQGADSSLRARAAVC